MRLIIRWSHNWFNRYIEYAHQWRNICLICVVWIIKLLFTIDEFPMSSILQSLRRNLYFLIFSENWKFPSGSFHTSKGCLVEIADIWLISWLRTFTREKLVELLGFVERELHNTAQLWWMGTNTCIFVTTLKSFQFSDLFGFKHSKTTNSKQKHRSAAPFDTKT